MTDGYLIDAPLGLRLLQLARRPDPPGELFRPGISADGAFMPCKLVMDGGLPGDGTTPCTFTYTVKTIDDQVIKAAVPLTTQRPALGRMLPAARGAFIVGGLGEIELWWCDEVPDRFPCTTPAPGGGG